MVSRVRKDFKVQSAELKGQSLLRYSRGRRAIETIVDAVANRTQIAAHHKRFALASKFFEYVFEPLVADVNSVFYESGFHRFIGTLVYVSMLAKRERATELSRRFEMAARADDSQFRDLIALHVPDEREPIEQILRFCIQHRDAILRELEFVRSMGGWTLELNVTSLW